MIELIAKAQEVAKSSLEGLTDKMRLPELSDNNNYIGVTDQELARRAEASAHFACQFFDLPDTPVRAGKDIGVYEHNLGDKADDVLEYSVKQFRDMDCTSIADMTKTWFHECGHRVLQGIVKEPWVDELGADFFAGVSAEMSGLPKGGLEKILSVQKPSESHPGGATRLMAMEYGRFIASQMKEKGIKPTWQNCIEAFQSSPFWQISYKDFIQSHGNPLQGAASPKAFIDNKAYHYGKAADAQYKVDSNLKRSQAAAERGDYKLAKDYAHSASRWQTTVRDETRAANRSTKLVDGQNDGWTGFIDNKAYHYGKAADAQAKVNSNLKRSQEAAERGDFSQAKDYARSASRWQTTVRDENRAADRSKKIIEDKQNENLETGKTGGSYGELKREGWGWNDIPPHEIHHIPSNESSSLETVDGPAIVMEYTDHRKTASCGNSREAKEYRAYQKQLIDDGRFAEALQMDVDDLHDKFGTKYDISIAEAQAYVKSLKETGTI